MGRVNSRQVLLSWIKMPYADGVLSTLLILTEVSHGLNGASTAQCPQQPLFQFLGTWVGMGNFLPRDILDSSFLLHLLCAFSFLELCFPFSSWFLQTSFPPCIHIVSWKETFKWLEAAAGCKVTGADSGLAQAQSCKSVKCIAHNFLVPALLGSRALLG